MAGLAEDQGPGICGTKETEEKKKPTQKTLSKEDGGRGERDMAPTSGNSIHRSTSRPQLDVSKAEIEGNVEEKYPTILLPNQSDDISHLALDIGGKIKVHHAPK